MNNDELKKKIVEVLKPVIRAGNISCNEENACKKCWFPCEIERTAGRLADALIAAGIGDVKESENKATAAEIVAQAAASTAIEKIEEWKHLAEVAERALDLCETAYILSLNHRATEGVSLQAITSDLGVHKFFIEQAEKELAEERKSD